MPSFEKISGDKIDGLIKALVKNRTLVKVAVPETDYEQLTIITTAQKDNGGGIFQIDPPEGLLQAIRDGSNRVLLFEFSNEDKLPHRFEAALKEDASGIWLWYPDLIQRQQLRNNFRIKPPAKAVAEIFFGETKVTTVIENISIGGIFVHCPNTCKDVISPGLKSGNIDLTFTFDGGSRKVTIDKAIVRRVEGRTITKHFGMALEFLHIRADAKKRLTQIVYDMQRDHLRSRSRK